jgi:hypothetical protein
MRLEAVEHRITLKFSLSPEELCQIFIVPIKVFRVSVTRIICWPLLERFFLFPFPSALSLSPSLSHEL